MGARVRAILAVLGVVGVSAGADTLRVLPDGAGDYSTIQAAVDAAVDGDLILLGDGTFRGPGNWDIQVLDKSVTIASESGDPTRCLIDCEDGGIGHWALRIMFSGEQVLIEGLGFIHGDSGIGCGGAVSVSGCAVTFRDCVFTGNTALYGGAIVAAGIAYLSIQSCTFHDNEATATYGGGAALAMDDMGAAHLSHCIVAFGRGGRAFDSLGGTIDLECCDVYGNVDGDYVGTIEGELGVEGNLSEDPLFCDAAGLDLHLHSDSPCAPAGPCGLIGALPVGCGPTPAFHGTWGSVKAMYRQE